jgi:membrane protein
MWKLLKGTVVSFFEDEALSRGAAIAFYTVTSLAPVLLIVIAIAGLVFGQEAAQNAILGQLSGLMGQQTAEILQTAIASAAGKSSGILATVIGVATLLVTASGIFGEMQTALNKIWKAKPKSGTVSRLVRARAASLGLVAALGFLLIVSLVVSAGLTALGDYLNSILPFGSLVLSVLNFVVSLALLSVLFAAIYKILPDRQIAWRDVIVGAVVTALLFTAGKSLIGWYLGSSAVASSYGAAAGLILLLLWVYYSAQIFLLGAEFTKVYATRHGSKLEGMGAEDEDSPSVDRAAGTKRIPASSTRDNKMTIASIPEGHMATDYGDNPSLAQLEREAERDRRALVNTVEALQDRLSPTALKRDVQGYVQDKKESILRSLEQRARENPLQAVAIAAGAAYPLWRIVTSIPAPLLLVGAGLALARRTQPGGSRSGAGSQGFVSHARDRLGEATDVVKQKFEEVSETAQQTVQRTVQAARETAEQTSARISAIKSQASQGAESLTAKASETFSQAAETARTVSSDAASAASAMVSAGYRDGAQATARAGEQMQQTGQRAHETFAETVQRHPIIVGAVGLAIGAIIAAALPVTRQEEQLLGDAGSELKKKGQDVASEGVEAFKGAAREVYQDTLAYAREQGLSAEGVREAAANVGEKVKEVIAKAKESTAGPGRPDDASSPNPLSRP